MAKRHLPLVQAASEPDEPIRPPWQWSLFAGGLIMIVWVVLALLVSPLATVLLEREVGKWATPDDLAARLGAAAPAVLARVAIENLSMHVVALGVACVVVGVVMGKWSPGRAIVECACAGAGVAVIATAAAVVSGVTTSPDGRDVVLGALVVLVPWSTGSAALGARWGRGAKRQLVGP
jgi:hypothetical protein